MMRRVFLFSLFGMLSSGCTGDVQYSGLTMNPFFPFDGVEREWEYVNEDTTILYKQVSVLDAEFELAADGSTRIYNIATEQRCLNNDESCEDKWLYSTRMSSSASKGAQIHGYSTESNPDVAFETPIAFTRGKMETGDAVQTVGVDGHDWTATFEAIEPCQIQWTDEWDDCAKIRLESSPEGHFLAGTYWAITGYNIVARQLTGDTGRWELIYAKWVP